MFRMSHLTIFNPALNKPVCVIIQNKQQACCLLNAGMENENQSRNTTAYGPHTRKKVLITATYSITQTKEKASSALCHLCKKKHYNIKKEWYYFVYINVLSNFA